MAGDDLVFLEIHRDVEIETIFEMGYVRALKQDRRLNGDGSAVAKEHKLLQPLMPFFVSGNCLNDKARHFGRPIVLLGDSHLIQIENVLEL